MSEELNIPVVDLADLESPKRDAQQRAREALSTGFGTYGLVFIRNHGINPEELEAFYESFVDFTDRGEEEKQKLSTPHIWFQRGWTPPNTEQAVVAGGQPDFKECYFMAPEPVDPLLAQEYPQIYAENVWPEDAQAFEDHYTSIGQQLHAIGLKLLRGSAEALELPAYQFEQATYGGAHVTRALRYIPLGADQVDTGILWGEEHTDFNLLTLLPGGRFLDEHGKRCPKPDDASGLYLRTRPSAEHPNGVLLRGKPPEGCIVAQVGQQLEILTGGTFLATPHVIKAPSTPGFSRVSMAHFVHVHAHQLLFPLERFQTTESINAYRPPVLAGTYGVKTLVDIGLAPPEAIEMLGYRHYDRLGNIREEESKHGA